VFWLFIQCPLFPKSGHYLAVLEFPLSAISGHVPVLSPRSWRRAPADYGCFNGLGASNFPPRAVGPLAEIRNYISTALVLAKNLQRTILFRDTLAKFS
ncbi:MAG: hypothetical protein WBC87_23890, partial [Pseudolabrys sp.]